jgi:hypothetical protein
MVEKRPYFPLRGDTVYGDVTKGKCSFLKYGYDDMGNVHDLPIHSNGVSTAT